MHLLVLGLFCGAQTTSFRENGKWGVKEKDQVIIKPVYDTIYGFDSTGKVCLACFRTKTNSSNKFMKVMVTSYACNYLNKQNERLFIKTTLGDTCSVFSLAKNSFRQYQNNNPYFVATVRGKKYLLTKDFTQRTFQPYLEITLSEDPYFYVTQNLNEAEATMTGLVNRKEEEIVPYLYSSIKVNPNDSLIIACSAGVRANADDDVYNYAGKKIESSRKHIDMVTKIFLIHKIFEPKEHYLLYNIKTKEEKPLDADDLKIYDHDEILVKIRNDWFIYDLNTNQKRPKNKS